MRFTITHVGRKVDNVDLTSATSAIRTGPAEWVDAVTLEIPFDRDLTQTEIDDVILLLSAVDDEEAQARRAIRVFLAKSPPTNAEVLAQVRLLSRITLRVIDRLHDTSN